MDKQPARSGRISLNWLLVVPFIAVLFPWFYNFDEPRLGGFPFFYWYQLAWIFLTAGLTRLAFRRGEA
ncbi:MAG TPA: DUF3311 domain-containing protein [Candidatus Acidoferrales bacterium]|nr:DUF3311 domain-containing protein [Candidatus Acidoferrales bacterium]